MNLEKPFPTPPEDVPPVSAESLVGAELLREPEGAPERRYPSTLGGMLYLIVLVTASIGLVLAWTGSWRLGIQILGASLWGAALGRLLLRNRDAGMLAVRNRYVDALLLMAVGAALVMLTLSIPNRP